MHWNYQFYNSVSPDQAASEVGSAAPQADGYDLPKFSCALRGDSYDAAAALLLQSILHHWLRHSFGFLREAETMARRCLCQRALVGQVQPEDV